MSRTPPDSTHGPPSASRGAGTPGDAADPFHLPVVPGDELDALLQGTQVPVVIDFFATWCGPCAWIIPTLRQLSEELGPDVRVIKIDVDEAPELAERFRIGSVPTVVLMQAGMEIGRSIGVEPEKVRALAREAVGRG